jgi:hypothetical protein
MPQRKPKQHALAKTQPAAVAELHRALSRRKKAELVDVLLELAHEDRGVLRQLTARFDVAAAADQLVAATRQAITDATAFDEREINYNCDYDDAAYREVKRNLGRLIEAGQLRLAMQLALELKKLGSYQVEMSGEGTMTEDIEDCLSVVLKALIGRLPGPTRCRQSPLSFAVSVLYAATQGTEGTEEVNQFWSNRVSGAPAWSRYRSVAVLKLRSRKEPTVCGAETGRILPHLALDAMRGTRREWFREGGVSKGDHPHVGATHLDCLLCGRCAVRHSDGRDCADRSIRRSPS